MPEDDPGAYAILWLAELGCHVPEWRDGLALAPRVRRFGLDLEPAERAARHAANLAREPLRSAVHRTRTGASSDGGT
jgi:hypothetical protein